MRFDDSLDTVLAGDVTAPGGVQAAWRQLVDLIGRGRAEPTPEALSRLRALRPRVPRPVREASARGLERATPPAALVELFVEDEPAIAAPLLRAASLSAETWAALLPRLAPPSRAVLRHRRDLPAETVRALEGYGPMDFLLANSAAVGGSATQSGGRAASAAVGPAPGEPSGPFRIADVVARLDAYQERRARGAPVGSAQSPAAAQRFRFETDVAGTVRWVDGAERAALVGLSLTLATPHDGSQVDGVAAGAFRRRAAFTDARLEVVGASDAAGSWRISAVPVFDPISGRFAGYRGTGRRPRADEQPGCPSRLVAGGDLLRQLVHELRTPITAIIGFAEMIEAQLLGPVDLAYRARAEAIRDDTRSLLAAIEDLDLAARIDGGALDLTRRSVPLLPLLRRAAEELAPLLRLRGTTLALPPEPEEGAVLAADPMAAARLLSRLLAAFAGVAEAGERIVVDAQRSPAVWVLSITRPRALMRHPGEALLVVEDEGDDPALLGVGFAMRLARNLATELGGALAIGETMVTLTLPAAVANDPEPVYQRT